MIVHYVKLLLRSKQKSILLIIQFSLAIVSLLLFMEESSILYNGFSQNIGYNTDHLIVGKISDLNTINTETDFNSTYSAMKDAMLKINQSELVESAGYLLFYPYSNSGSVSSNHNINFLTTGALDALNLELIAGKKFTEADEFSPLYYCMINETSYKQFKTVEQEPIGKDFNELYRKLTHDTKVENDASPKLIIKGVFKNFEMMGRFNNWTDRQLLLLSVYQNREKFNGQWNRINRLSSFVIRVKPDVDINEARYFVHNSLHSEIHNRDLIVEDCQALEAKQSKQPIIRFLVMLFINVMLLIIIIVGIFGITKQSIIKRVREIGIRIAFGATQKIMFKQFIAEYFLLNAFSTILGFAITLSLNKTGIYIANTTIIESLIAFCLLWCCTFLTVRGTIVNAARLRPNVSLHCE